MNPVVELVREALKDPQLRAEIRAIVAEAPIANDTAPERLVDVEEAARLLDMTPTAVRSAVGRGTLPCVRVGRRLRFRPSDLTR